MKHEIVFNITKIAKSAIKEIFKRTKTRHLSQRVLPISVWNSLPCFCFLWPLTVFVFDDLEHNGEIAYEWTDLHDFEGVFERSWWDKWRSAAVEAVDDSWADRSSRWQERRRHQRVWIVAARLRPRRGRGRGTAVDFDLQKTQKTFLDVDRPVFVTAACLDVTNLAVVIPKVDQKFSEN